MAKLTGESMNITEENIKKLQQLFPECACDGKVDFDKLKQVLGEFVDDDTERYNFTWNGKGRALRLSQTPSMGTLRPCKEESVDWDNTKNLYIEGDNLEVLKLLQKSYHSKIKLIYIDPPYNTGHDFVYPDDFTDSIEHYKMITGQVDEDGKAVTTNSDTSGRYHTDWMNMMYPRLRLARGLLKDNGAIFISIDDNEVDNLKKLCNEVFGEDNFVAQFPWQSRQSIQNDTDLSNGHEYVVAYAKIRRKENRRLKESNADKWFTDNSFVCLPLPLDKEKFSNPDNDPRGLWKADPFDAPNIRPNLTYEIENPNTGEKILPPQGRHWRTEESSYLKYLSDNRIVFGKTGESRPQLKVFYDEKKMFGSVDNTWWTGDKCGTSTQGTKELIKLFGGQSPFDTPKPVQMLKKIIQLVSRPEDDDIVMDFFSGSGTMADAIMQQNIEDGGKRRCISVQFPEKCSDDSIAKNMGFDNLCEVGKERIRRAGAELDADLDKGFKVFKLDSSNIKKWQPKEDLEASILDYVDNFLEDGRTEMDVLYEIMLKMGLDLNCPIDTIHSENVDFYSVGSGALMVCLADEITENVAKQMVKTHNELQSAVWKVVFKDNGFSSDSSKTNIKEIFKCAGLKEEAFTTI